MSEEQALKVVEVTDENGDDDTEAAIAEFDEKVGPKLPERSNSGRGVKHEPTDAKRYVAYALSAEGVPQHRIAERIGISRSTLQKYYSAELKEGRDISLERVEEKAYEMALSGNYPGMTTWWLKREEGIRKRTGEDSSDGGGIITYLPDNGRQRDEGEDQDG